MHVPDSAQFVNDSVWDNLTAILRETLHNDSLNLTDTRSARDVEGWDPVMNVLLAVAAENKFRLKFGAGEIQQLQNVGDLATLTRRKQA